MVYQLSLCTVYIYHYYHTCTQIYPAMTRVKSDCKMVLITDETLGEWRFACPMKKMVRQLQSGEQFVTTTGTTEMHKLCAGNLATKQNV